MKEKHYEALSVTAEDKDYKVLVGAVERYVNSREYPEIDTVLAILGIEKREKDGTHTEL